MAIEFGREICCDLSTAEQREWLVTNGLGSYASGTVAGVLTRAYHGLLIAALKPPLAQTLLVAKLDETAHYDGTDYPLHTNRWADGTVDPRGYVYIEHFSLEGSVPTWQFACADALLTRQIWMQPGADTTYVRYTLTRATRPLKLALKVLVNYRSHHGHTRAGDWRMAIRNVARGVAVSAFAGAVPFYVLAEGATVRTIDRWHFGFKLVEEQNRGLESLDDHLHVATLEATLQPGEAWTVAASTEPEPDLDGAARLTDRRDWEAKRLKEWETVQPEGRTAPAWVRQLVLAADQFVVERPLPGEESGRTILAGYHWFGDWGRDTMISLSGLTLTTGRPEVAAAILRTFARYVNRGMLPNRFPDDGSPLTDADYNTVDATLWYFEAIRAYCCATGDQALLGELFAVLEQIIDHHEQGTRFDIRQDPVDGLLHAGEAGVQLTWMDAKVGDWVVTPRIGKPVEVNALWYHALRSMADFARSLGRSAERYDAMAAVTLKGFARFWNRQTGCCYDLIDGPQGEDAALRPNQLFAVSLLHSPLTESQQRAVVDICGRKLLTSYGLRSLTGDDPRYQGHYRGDQRERDGAYHRGTAWGWLLGVFVQANLRAFGDPVQAESFLAPMTDHLGQAGLGTVSEIFEGEAPMVPRGCIAQAWSVAEILRAWVAVRTWR